MRVCKLATALALIAASAYALHEEDKLIDIEELWDELNEEDEVIDLKDELESADPDLYAEYWGYIEEIVSIVDAAVDDEELYDNDFWALEDFFESLDEDDYADLEAELEAVIDEFYDFLDTAEDNADFDSAFQALKTMWEWGSSQDTPGAYWTIWRSSGGAMWTQLQDLAATVIDPNTQEFVDNFDVDATLNEFETTVGMSEAQDALLAAATEVLAAWNAVKDDFQDTIDTAGDHYDGIVTEYDAMVDDETHETTQKLMSIAVGVIDDIGESDLLEDAYNEVEDHLNTFNGWIGQDNWDTVYDDIVDEVESALNAIYDELDEGLPEREYAEESDHDSDDEFDDENPEDSEDDGEDPDEVPDSAFSFAASATALLASVAVISF